MGGLGAGPALRGGPYQHAIEVHAKVLGRDAVTVLLKEVDGGTERRDPKRFRGDGLPRGPVPRRVLLLGEWLDTAKPRRHPLT
ncbi:MAG TPA: hypothetical protein VGA22_05990, partial [Gemmatimonadales bacterium]